jgi:hypothetical protein
VSLHLGYACRLYFDHGSEGLDAEYAPYQQQVDQLCTAAGYTEVCREQHQHRKRSLQTFAQQSTSCAAGLCDSPPQSISRQGPVAE